MICKGARTEGADDLLKDVSEASTLDIETSDVIALGCPSMGDEVLEGSSN